jgi:PAS domain S-box-containing protein
LTDPIELEEALNGLVARISSLRDARTAYPADLGPTLDAALAELDTAEDLLRAAIDGNGRRGEGGRSSGRPGGGRNGGVQREHKLLRQVYRSLPVPVIVMDGTGTIRRVNAETSHLLGSPAGYLTGRAFPLLVDVSRRAAFRSHLTAVLHGEETAALTTRLSHQGRTHIVQLVLTRLHLPGEPQEAIVAVALPTEVQLPEPVPEMRAADEPLIMEAARRYELMSELTRLMLDEESLRLPVALLRAARLLGSRLADWVIADLVPDRAAVIGPADQPVARLQRSLEGMDPARAPIVEHVLASEGGVVHEMLEDDGLLGTLPDGASALAAMGAGSVLAVPIRDADETRGVLTLVRLRDHPPFTLADLGLAEDIGEHLGLALRTQRAFANRAQAADTLQTGVVPRTLPDIPGFEAAAVYHPGSAPWSIGGEFYDVFPVADGWGFVLAGAAGKGEEAAAVSAMVRGGFRMLSVSGSDPAQVIGRLSDALLLQETGMFVMAVAGFVAAARTGRGRAAGRIRLASAGAHPPAVLRADGSVRFTSGGGVPLGFEAGAETASEEVVLAEGETLVLYSDGLVGSRGQAGDTYGETRLTELLARCAGQAPGTLVKAIEADHRAFCAGHPVDEVTILTLRRSR